VRTLKADEYCSLDGEGDFSGEEVSVSPILELESSSTWKALQDAIKELESGKADQVEITRVPEGLDLDTDTAKFFKALKKSNQSLADALQKVCLILEDHEKRLQKLEKAGS
jgi:hypothetical protein